MSNKKLRIENDLKYGQFCVYDAQDNLVRAGGMTESDATSLAIKVNGRIEHQDPDTKVWSRW